MLNIINIIRLTLLGLLFYSLSALSAEIVRMADSPFDARTPEQNSGVVIGKIVIPSIKVDEVVREGVAQRIIDLGVAHWYGTAQFGRPGNVVLLGHRTVKTRPFYHLDELFETARIFVSNSKGERFEYRVFEKFYVNAKEANFVIDPPRIVTSMLTLVACHPLYSETQRIIIRAELVGEIQLQSTHQ